jgi:hypothetical protein
VQFRFVETFVTALNVGEYWLDREKSLIELFQLAESFGDHHKKTPGHHFCSGGSVLRQMMMHACDTGAEVSRHCVGPAEVDLAPRAVKNIAEVIGER